MCFFSQQGQIFHEVARFILALQLWPLPIPEERKSIVSPPFSPQESKFYVLLLKNLILRGVLKFFYFL